MAIDPGGGLGGSGYPAPGGETSGAGPVGQDVNPSGGSASSGSSPANKPTGPGPGPQYSPSLHNSTSPSPSVFDNYPGPEVDAAKTIVKQEMALLGWPQSVDTEQMALDLLKNGLENKPQDAFEYLWNSKYLTNDMRKASPWARFGQDADTFHQNLASIQDTMKRLTGMNVALDPGLIASANSGANVGPRRAPGGDPVASSDPMALLLQSALKGGWTQQQILDALQAGSFTSLAGQKVDLTGITAAQPWLLAGQSYQQEAQQFRTIYGAAPVDTAQLAGWFRFNQSAGQIGPWYARQAITEAVPKTPLGTSQTVVR